MKNVFLFLNPPIVIVLLRCSHCLCFCGCLVSQYSQSRCSDNSISRFVFVLSHQISGPLLPGLVFVNIPPCSVSHSQSNLICFNLFEKNLFVKFCFVVAGVNISNRHIWRINQNTKYGTHFSRLFRKISAPTFLKWSRSQSARSRLWPTERSGGVGRSGGRWGRSESK